ncbi:MAG: six-hairpin glycosidase [Sphingobacteriaceae bacterium]
MKGLSHKLFFLLLSVSSQISFAQDTIRYTGSTLSNIDYHHGQLSPVIGVHNIQVFRANREHPEWAQGNNWTYNHQPMLAYWNNRYYLQYLSNPVGEHIAPGRTLLATSTDGYHWSAPEVIFPPYKIPDGYQKDGYPGVAKDLYAVMHQRMGFYTAKSGRLLTLGYYGIALDLKDDPNDGKGIGRVVREIYKDGTYGPIYFIRNNKNWDKTRSAYPFYTSSKDKGFVKACNELLATPLMMQQWVEEADRDDPLIPLKREVKAFSYYHLPDGKVIGLWKHALTAQSADEGRTWLYNPLRAPGFINSNAKIWGQRTSDGKYATVYNPSEFRWPLALSTSADGLNYTDLLLVNGEISTMRYGGNYKSYGPQYVRGIVEGNGLPPDKNMWLTYSMNKEDIWVAKVQVPVSAKEMAAVDEDFSKMPDGAELNKWNLFSPLWAKTQIETYRDKKVLALHDQDPFDYAKAERVIKPAQKLTLSFTVTPNQNDRGQLQVEVQDAKGIPALRLVFDEQGALKIKAGYRYSGLMNYEAGKTYQIVLELDCTTRIYKIKVNGQDKGAKVYYAPIDAFSRVMFRTGEVRHFPDAETPTDQNYDLKNAGEKDPEAIFYIHSLKTN